MKPFLKWVGGKQDLVEHLGIPDEIQGDYVEPFVGGGSVLLHVLSTKKVKGKIRVSDTNKILIDTYKRVKESPEELCVDLQKLVAPVGNEVRTRKNFTTTSAGNSIQKSIPRISFF